MKRHLIRALRLIAMGFLVMVPASAQSIPAGYTIPDITLSPDHTYGVTVPENAHYDDIHNPQNKLVEVKTGRVLAVIKANAGWDRGNYDNVLPANWSADGSLMLWHVDGKWSPTALVLLQIEKGTVKWQIDLLKTAQQAILAQTKKAQPQTYAAAKKQNAGSGSAFPDGFTVDVSAGGSDASPLTTSTEAPKPISLPLAVHADLTSNPKQLDSFPKNAELDSELDGVVDENGKFTVTKFQLTPPQGQ